MSEETQKEESQSPQLNTQNIIIVGAVAVVMIILGWLGFKFLMSSFDSYKLTLIDGPQEVSVGSVATFTWRIDGPATAVNQTVIYLSLESNPGTLDKNVKPSDTKYDLMVKDFSQGEYNIPLQFIGNIVLDTPGTYYYRAHTVIKEKNYWTEERVLEVMPAVNKVTLLDIPANAVEDTNTVFTWKLEGPPRTINYTTVFFGTTSSPGDLGKETSPSATNYKAKVDDFWGGTYNIPLQFIGNETIATAGSYFVRGYALVDGEHLWTEEKTMEVAKAE